MGKFKQGVFTPSHPEKWLGVSQIVYRSSWEFAFNKWADGNPSVTKISSEEIQIPYFYEIDQKWHRYFPDYLMEYIDKNGETRVVCVEIKPHHECIPPIKARKSDKRYLNEVLTYEKNQAKWKAADAWCKERNIKFMVLNEYDLGIKSFK